MSIFVGKTDGEVLLGASSADTTIHNVAANRTLISAANLQNNHTGDVSVSIYRSPNSTSASGNKIGEVAIGANADADINEIIGQGLDADEYLVAVVDTAGVSASAVVSQVTYTSFTAGS